MGREFAPVIVRIETRQVCRWKQLERRGDALPGRQFPAKERFA